MLFLHAMCSSPLTIFVVLHETCSTVAVFTTYRGDQNWVRYFSCKLEEESSESRWRIIFVARLHSVARQPRMWSAFAARAYFWLICNSSTSTPRFWVSFENLHSNQLSHNLYWCVWLFPPTCRTCLLTLRLFSWVAALSSSILSVPVYWLFLTTFFCPQAFWECFLFYHSGC